jgi:hypothetical protein
MFPPPCPTFPVIRLCFMRGAGAPYLQLRCAALFYRPCCCCFRRLWAGQLALQSSTGIQQASAYRRSNATDRNNLGNCAGRCGWAAWKTNLLRWDGFASEVSSDDTQLRGLGSWPPDSDDDRWALGALNRYIPIIYIPPFPPPYFSVNLTVCTCGLCTVLWNQVSKVRKRRHADAQ